MKLKKLLEIVPSLQALGNTKLPAKVGYRVAKSINLINPKLTAYEEARRKLVESLGKPIAGKPDQFSFYEEDKDGAIVFDTREEFKTQHDSLIEEEEDIKFPTITLADLGDVKIEPAHLAALDGIVLVEAA